MRTAALLVPALAVLLSACGGPQSMLGGGGSSAAAIETLWWAMFWAALVIFALVLFLAAVGGWRGRLAAPGTLMVAAGGLVLPVALLSVLLVYSVSLGERLATATERAQLRIEVEGLQWWWRVEYPGAPGAVLANEIRLPVGVQVEVVLGSPDVIHSLWIPGLAGKQDMTPGRKAHLALLAEKPGVYRGQCAEFCGAQHALMALYVVAMPPTEFDSWLARQAEPAPTSENALLRRGQEVFIEAGCGACHTVRGTPAKGRLGPDLTHVGGRLSIGAGLLPANIGAIQGWIADAQNHKPGNLMPSFNRLSGPDLNAVGAWLASLQ